YAGCPNLVMSLWQADDEATNAIMQSFYAHLKDGKDKDEAIRQAKLDFLASSDRVHPHYWSSFVMIGDNAPIGGRSTWWMWGLGLVVLGIGGVLSKRWMDNRRQAA
ncbi:MAG: CHAT domain-containing protein, partial [Bacteroidota bacterium]